MDYQLVIQFPQVLFKDFDRLIELEDSIDEGLGNLGELDGHDIGSGSVNFFILTRQPARAFERVQSLPIMRGYLDMKAAYREVEGEEFVSLHPAGSTDFDVI